MSEHSTSRPPLPILPIEIIYSIIRYSDVPTACNFARTARCFNAVAESLIWRSLHLLLPGTVGPRRSCPGLASPVRHTCLDPAEGEVSETLYRAELRAKVRAIMMSANARRWRSVREVVMMPRPGSMPALVQILDMVSENMTELEIIGTGDQDWIHSVPLDRETFDVRMIDCGITFPSLTHVWLIDQPLRFHGFIPLLCNAAPNLHLLHADLLHELSSDDPRGLDLDPPSPTFERPTRIKVLRVDCDWVHDPDDPEAHLEPILSLLRHCPSLDEAAVGGQGPGEQIWRIRADMEAMKNLKDLIWFEGRRRTQNLLEAGLGDVRFPSLKRLVVVNDVKILTAVPETPSLETLVHFCDTFPHIHTPQHASPVAHPLIPSFARQIRNSPHLSQIRIREYPGGNMWPLDQPSIDVLIDTAMLSGEISSFKHGDQELIHARLLETKIEISDEPFTPRPFISGMEWTDADRPLTVSYTALDGIDRVKTYEDYTPEDGGGAGGDEPRGVWRDYTDWQGMVVPLEVIEEMRRVQGASEEEWKRRGVHVGDAAWKVLEDWRAKEVAA